MARDQPAPLSDRHRALAADAYMMTRRAMEAYRNRYPDLADEIDGEFDMRVCRTIHKFDSIDIDFRAWVYATLRFALKKALYRAGRGRNQDFREGRRAFVPITAAAGELARMEYADASECVPDHVPARSKRMLQMYMDGYSTNAIGRAIGLSGPVTRKHLRRAILATRMSLEASELGA